MTSIARFHSDMFHSYELNQLTAKPKMTEMPCVGNEYGDLIKRYMGTHEYTIKQIVQATGICNTTVRSWLKEHAPYHVKVKDSIYWRLK